MGHHKKEYWNMFIQIATPLNFSGDFTETGCNTPFPQTMRHQTGQEL
jgi:hypothetical protein